MSVNTQPAAEQEILGEAASATELFIEKNGRMLICAIAAVVVIALGIFAYRTFVLEPREQQAVEMIFAAQNHFDAMQPDYTLALMGDENGAGFLDVIESYGSTAAGNLAKHYAGVCYLKLDNMESAAKYLAMYKATDGIPATIINAQNLGLQGDIASEGGNYAEALKLYAEAVESADNELTSPIYLLKAALVASKSGDKAKALELLETIKDCYPNSTQSRDADKYIGTL